MQQQPPSPGASPKDKPVLGIEVGDSQWVVDTARSRVYRVPDTLLDSGLSAPGAVQPDAVVSVSGVGTLLALLEQRMCVASAMMQRKLRLRGDLSKLGSVAWLWSVLLDPPEPSPNKTQRSRLATWGLRLQAAAQKVKAMHASLVKRCIRAVFKPMKATVATLLQVLALFRPWDRLKRRRFA